MMVKPWLISVGAHLALFSLILLGVQFNSAAIEQIQAVAVEPVQATFIDAEAIAQRQEQQRKEQQRKEQQQQRKAEQIRQQRERERQQQQKVAEQKRQAEAERQRQQELAEQQQKRLEQQRQDEALAQQQENLEREKKQQREEQLAKQLAAEQAAQRQQEILSERDKYRALIKQRIEANLFVNDGFRGKRCRLNIRLAPGGLVLKVTVLEGDEQLCRAARTAISNSGDLPVSRNPDVFAELKNINLTVEQ